MHNPIKGLIFSTGITCWHWGAWSIESWGSINKCQRQHTALHWCYPFINLNNSSHPKDRGTKPAIKVLGEVWTLALPCWRLLGQPWVFGAPEGAEGASTSVSGKLPSVLNCWFDRYGRSHSKAMGNISIRLFKKLIAILSYTLCHQNILDGVPRSAPHLHFHLIRHQGHMPSECLHTRSNHISQRSH